MHCKDCGGRMVILESGSWEDKFKCITKDCDTRLHLSYGDRMGGATDHYNWSKGKFKYEFPVKKKKQLIKRY